MLLSSYYLACVLRSCNFFSHFIVAARRISSPDRTRSRVRFRKSAKRTYIGQLLPGRGTIKTIRVTRVGRYLTARPRYIAIKISRPARKRVRELRAARLRIAASRYGLIAWRMFVKSARRLRA